MVFDFRINFLDLPEFKIYIHAAQLVSLNPVNNVLLIKKLVSVQLHSTDCSKGKRIYESLKKVIVQEVGPLG